MNYFWAFCVGGAICVAGQLLIDLTGLTPARILTGYVVAGVVLSAIGWYAPLAEFAGCGATVPLLGFGHLLAKGVRTALQEEGAVGICQEAESPAMTEEATAAFNKATEGFVGVDYVPVALLSTQTVAGTNYRILCEATTVYPGAEMHYAVVNVYESLEGNANIISVTDGYVS